MNWSVMVFLISCIVRAMVLVRSEELGVRSEELGVRVRL